MKKSIRAIILFVLVSSAVISCLAGFQAESFDVMIFDFILSLFLVAVIAKLEPWWRDLPKDDDSEPFA